MMFGRQVHYCPNCGEKMYNAKIEDRTKQTMCSVECIQEWELKYARCIMGKDQEI